MQEAPYAYMMSRHYEHAPTRFRLRIEVAEDLDGVASPPHTHTEAGCKHPEQAAEVFIAAQSITRHLADALWILAEGIAALTYGRQLSIT